MVPHFLALQWYGLYNMQWFFGYTCMSSGQIMSTENTDPSPQMVVKSKGIPLDFQGNRVW